MDGRQRLQEKGYLSESDSDESLENGGSNFLIRSFMYQNPGYTPNTNPQLLINSDQNESDDAVTEINPEDIADALRAARESSPAVINVVNHPSKMNICILGCQGNKNTDFPMQVAKLMNDNTISKPDLLIILGDNFYPDGVPSPVDAKFEKQFHNIYNNEELKNIFGIPCIVILGNHDGGRDTESYIKSWVPGKSYIFGSNTVQLNEAELQQIAHSMIRHPSDPDTTIYKPLFFKQETVEYKDLPKHLMPHFFHSWIFDKLQIFALNSNTYVKDFIMHMKEFAEDSTPTYADYMKKLGENKVKNPIMNQAAWLDIEYAEAMAAKRSTIFTMHHPMISIGKREYPNGWDAHHYLTPEDITLINAILKLSLDQNDFKDQLVTIFKNINTAYHAASNANYNEIMRNIIYGFQKKTPLVVGTAHDHSNYYYNNINDNTNTGHKICQVVAGGGGSKDLQHRAFYGNHESTAAFSRKHGFSMISCDTANPAVMDINMLTTDGMHLHFNNLSSIPLRKPEIDEKVKTMREIVLGECAKYQAFIHEQQTLCDGTYFKKAPPIYVNLYSFTGLYNAVTSHTYRKTHFHPDMDVMHDMMNYLNQENPSSYNDTVTFIHDCMEKLYNKTFDHSLYMGINQKLQKAFADKSIDQLYKDVNISFNLTT